MTDLVIVPATPPQRVDLDATDDELAPLVLELAQRERALNELRHRVEGELMARMRSAEHRTRRLPSGHTLQLRTGRRRVWDPDDLETVARDLVDRGVINASVWSGLIRHETKVDGTLAVRLLSQLDGSARSQLDDCYHWQDGRPSLTVLPPEQAALDATAEEDE